MREAAFILGARNVFTGLRRWSARHERFLWTGLIVVVVAVQWPMRKGFYSARRRQRRRRRRSSGGPTCRLRFSRHSAQARRCLWISVPIWCPPCIVMKHDVWPDDGVEDAVARSYIPVLIDVDNDSMVGERYGVRGIPTVLVLDAAGQVIRRGSFLTASGMVKFLTRATIHTE